MAEAMLFKKCLGLNDSKTVGSQVSVNDPKAESAGSTQLIDCLNMTIGHGGSLEKVPTLSVSYTQNAMVAAALIGSTGANPGPATSKTFSGMPSRAGSFVYNARLYAYKDKFLQYSEPYHYTLWNIADNFIGHNFNILQAGAIPGAILCAHAEGVTVYVCGDPFDPQIIKKFYPCAYIAKTLYSGFISKALGYGHLFLCDDGVYMVGQDGAIVRLSGDTLEYISTLNTSYTGSLVDDGKYLAFGNSVCLEFDVALKAGMKRYIAVGGSGVLPLYNAVTATITQGASDLTTSCFFTLPYSYLGVDGKKSFSDLYVTGQIDGDPEITARDQQNPEEPERWTITASDLGVVQQKRIKLPKGTVGSRVSFDFRMSSGSLKIEEIKVVFGSGNRR